MEVSDNGSLEALLDEYKGKRNRGEQDWDLWQILYDRRMKALDDEDWETLQEFADRDLVKEFERKAR